MHLYLHTDGLLFFFHHRAPDYSHQNPFLPLSHSSTLEQVAKALQTVRRVPLQDESGKVVGLVSQAAVCHWLADHVRSSSVRVSASASVGVIVSVSVSVGVSMSMGVSADVSVGVRKELIEEEAIYVIHPDKQVLKAGTLEKFA